MHFHRDVYPATLGLVAELARHRKLLGYEPTPEGAYIDWKTMTERVSATERAILLIAEGCAGLERHGGAPPVLQAAVVQAVSDAV